MRLQDINELLEAAEQGINFLEKENVIAQTNNEKPNLSRTKIKGILEHLRSVLDYVAVDITETLKEECLKKNIQAKKVGKIYFPIRDNSTEFSEVIQKNFCYLKEFYPSIYELVENIQPFEGKDNWLQRLSKLTIQNKHNGLTEQQKTEYDNVTVGGNKGVIIIPAGPIKNFNIQSVNILGKEVLTTPLNYSQGKLCNPEALPIDSKIEPIKEFRWKGDYYSLIIELRAFHQNISSFKDAVYKNL